MTEAIIQVMRVSHAITRVEGASLKITTQRSDAPYYDFLISDRSIVSRTCNNPHGVDSGGVPGWGVTENLPANV